jgi:hypothetical protein
MPTQLSSLSAGQQSNSSPTVVFGTARGGHASLRSLLASLALLAAGSLSSRLASLASHRVSPPLREIQGF